MTHSLSHHIRECIARYRTRHEAVRRQLIEHLEKTTVVDPDGQDTHAAMQKAQELTTEMSTIQSTIEGYQRILDAAEIGYA